MRHKWWLYGDPPSVRRRWWWSATRKYLYDCAEGRAFQKYLWELSDHGRQSIHLGTFVNSRYLGKEEK